MEYLPESSRIKGTLDCLERILIQFGINQGYIKENMNPVLSSTLISNIEDSVASIKGIKSETESLPQENVIDEGENIQRKHCSKNSSRSENINESTNKMTKRYEHSPRSDNIRDVKKAAAKGLVKMGDSMDNASSREKIFIERAVMEHNTASNKDNVDGAKTRGHKPKKLSGASPKRDRSFIKAVVPLVKGVNSDKVVAPVRDTDPFSNDEAWIMQIPTPEDTLRIDTSLSMDSDISDLHPLFTSKVIQHSVSKEHLPPLSKVDAYKWKKLNLVTGENICPRPRPSVDFDEVVQTILKLETQSITAMQCSFMVRIFSTDISALTL